LRKLLLLGLCLPLAAWAGWEFEFDFDNEKPWQELQAKIPAYPKTEEAIEFFVSAATDNKFFIDPSSIEVGDDGVVRYTLIIRSSAGAMNISYEGIRCSSHEKKTYAFGSKGEWSRNKYSRWTPIKYEDRNRQHHMLYDDFFCPGFIIVKDAKEAIFGLKAGIHPRAERK
jgi:hypothetical protein